jgi:hypothetical protein
MEPMPEPDAHRDLDSLIKATEENRAELKKTQKKVESLETAIQAMKNSRFDSERRPGKQHPI